MLSHGLCQKKKNDWKIISPVSVMDFDFYFYKAWNYHQNEKIKNSTYNLFCFYLMFAVSEV